MQTKVSSKGQVVLPSPIRRKLGLETGDPLEARIEAGRVVLIPHRKAKRRPRIRISDVTGMPVLSLGRGGAKITNESVRELLADFP